MKAVTYNNQLNYPQLLVAKLTNKQEYKDKIKGYVDYLISSQMKTPNGLEYIDQWGTLRHTANSALIALQVNNHFSLQ
jgi:Glycosyl hydrolase family 9.